MAIHGSWSVEGHHQNNLLVFPISDLSLSRCIWGGGIFQGRHYCGRLWHHFIRWYIQWMNFCVVKSHICSVNKFQQNCRLVFASLYIRWVSNYILHSWYHVLHPLSVCVGRHRNFQWISHETFCAIFCIAFDKSRGANVILCCFRVLYMYWIKILDDSIIISWGVKKK